MARHPTVWDLGQPWTPTSLHRYPSSLHSRARIARVADSMEAVTVEAGENLCLQGEFAYRFFVIEAGTADVTTDGVRVAALGAGNCSARSACS